MIDRSPLVAGAVAGAGGRHERARGVQAGRAGAGGRVARAGDWSAACEEVLAAGRPGLDWRPGAAQASAETNHRGCRMCVPHSTNYTNI